MFIVKRFAKNISTTKLLLLPSTSVFSFVFFVSQHRYLNHDVQDITIQKKKNLENIRVASIGLMHPEA